MIWFGGTALGDAADVRVVDIDVGFVPLAPVSRRYARGIGEVYAGMSAGARRVTVRAALISAGINARAEEIRRIICWAAGDRPKKLCVAGYEGCHLMAVCTSFPQAAMYDPESNRLTVEFTAFDPLWRSDSERRAACGNAIYVNGSAPPEARIEYTLTRPGNAAWSDEDGEMRFSSLPAGKLTVDLARQTAEINGMSAMPHFDVTGGFLRLCPGRGRVTGPGEIVWRERWF